MSIQAIRGDHIAPMRWLRVFGGITGAHACSAAGTGRSGSGPVFLWWWWCGPQSPLVVHQSWWMPQTHGGSAWSSGRPYQWWSQPAAKQPHRPIENGKVKRLFCHSLLQESCFLSVNRCLTYIFWDGDLCCDDRASNITVWASTTYSRRWERTFMVNFSFTTTRNKKKQSLWLGNKTLGQ